ncbi:hypothetical protein SAMN05216559_2923 [Halomicrobium zhouii]|uniref:Uncharacterized protein n=1 Tax=Halomicrobium zhouii TaxID=767519 RepID=A0A1I6LRC6_9EURY|nr:hypothetical protein [Halomicrobium zhouii]SFS05802.1 hypothetical protein SAMN05216559_2923 [Halomicrobium zhouii]
MSNNGYRIREKLDSEYRIVCPSGHTSLSAAETTETAYCRACGRSYPFEELVDQRWDDAGRDP